MKNYTRIFLRFCLAALIGASIGYSGHMDTRVMPIPSMAALLPRIAAAFPSSTGNPGYLTNFSTDVLGINLRDKPWATVDTLDTASTFNDVLTNTNASRALWYRTTNGAVNDNKLGAVDNVRYNNDRPLFMYVANDGTTLIKEISTKHILEDTPCLRVTTAGAASVESCKVAAPNSAIGSSTDTLISLNSDYSDTNIDFSSSSVPSELTICTSNLGSGTNTGVDRNWGERSVNQYKFTTPRTNNPGTQCRTTGGTNQVIISAFLGSNASRGLIDIASSQIYPAGFFDRDRTIEPTGNETVVVKTMPNAIAVGTVISIAGGGGSGGTAIATVSGGAVTGVVLGSAGTGYTAAPTVTITGAGTGATATASIDPVAGTITGITVNAGGTGYSNPVNDVTITLRANNPRTVFIFKLPVNTIIGRPVSLPIATTTTTNQDLDNGIGVKVKLDGVNPNNVFWIVGDNLNTTSASGDLTFAEPSNRSRASAALPTHRTILVGTFIGNGNFPRSYSGALPITTNPEAGSFTNGIGKNVEIRNGRFLGFTGGPMVTRVVLAPRTPANNPAGAAFGFRPAEAYIPYFTRSQRFATSPSTATTTDVNQINNFAPSSAPPAVPDNYQILFQEKDAGITSMSTIDEPLVLPVLQLNAPSATAATGTDNDSVVAFDDNTTINLDGAWTSRAVATEVNAYFVSGDSPSRSRVPYTTVVSVANPASINTLTAENNGGLPNFIRYMENWIDGDQIASTIKGGLIQNRRSLYATAPFAATAPFRDISADNDFASDMQSIFTSASGSIVRGTANGAVYTNGIPYKFYKSGSAQAIPYYFPPRRQWGYDVGLLTQTPDLFAERFSKPAPNPNEFFREVDRQDPYIKSLLCAYEPATSSLNSTNRKGGDNTIYQEPALPLSQRPTDCAPTPPTPTPVPTATP